MIKQKVFESIESAVKSAIENNRLGGLSDINDVKLVIETPKNTEFGDFAVNVSSFARFAKMPPPVIAQTIEEFVDLEDVQINIMGGFMNFKLGKSWLNKTVEKIINDSETFGSNNYGEQEKVLLEYVSANPTGPLHIGHGRWAAMGSSLANLMKFSGYDVTQEFYINDAGSQIGNLARSLWIRVLQELGQNVRIPTEGDEAKGYYPGEYLVETAKDYLKNNKEKAEKLAIENSDFYNPPACVIEEMASFAKTEMLDQQKKLMEKLGVDFQNYFKETSLHDSGEVKACLENLENKGETESKDGAIWFKTTKYGDDQDRVLIKKDGSYTYLTADIAYHYDKLQRGFERLINIWGADHHGYVPRMKASIEALGYNPESLEVLLGQLVNLIIGGDQVRMGKRKKMITLEDLVDDVGVDATRFWMIMRSIDTTLDFDVDLAKSSSDENPVFYVQYAHARMCSILRNAASKRFNHDTKEELPPLFTQEQLEEITAGNVDISALWNDEDEKAINATKNLILKLESFENIVLNAVKSRAPYIIARYSQELASEFHHFYNYARVLNVEENIMKARLALLQATKIVLANALNLLGVSKPESM